MRKTDHRRIARAICCHLGLDGEISNALIKGSIQPDLEREQFERHHSGRDATILSRLRSARTQHLKQNDSQAARSLGYALHFVQDKCSPGASFSGHDELERELARSRNWDYSLTYSPSCNIRRYRDVVDTVRGIEASADIDAIKEKAVTTSFLLAEAVLSTYPPPNDLHEQVRQIRRQHFTTAIPGACALGGVAATLVFFGVRILLMGLLTTATAGCAWFLAAITFCCVVRSLAGSDTEYNDSRHELAWFEVKLPSDIE